LTARQVEGDDPPIAFAIGKDFLLQTVLCDPYAAGQSAQRQPILRT
jgi:hypothetical protein